MSSPISAARRGLTTGLAGATAVLVTCGLAIPASAREPGPVPVAGAPANAANPYSPAVGHAYRNGLVPTLRRAHQMRAWAARQAQPAAAGTGRELTYGGGLPDHNGVNIGAEKVYLVFWGSQWGKAARNSRGYVTLAGDPSGEAPYLQALFKGLGTDRERWSGVMTQYCQGVAYNTLTCPQNSWHVGYPFGGALAGVWVDERAAEPTLTNGNQLGAEAIAAAEHFSHGSTAANRDAQYVIVSPTGTNPDGFNTPAGNFCAWHDDTSDPTLTGGPVNSPLDIAFTNLPYVADLGQQCGQSFVNAGTAGLLDGVSMIAGHEYAETITDQYPPFGWTVSDQNSIDYGAEIADMCAWNANGGKAVDVRLATGSFAMQSVWANDANGGQGGCENAHPLVLNSWVLNGGFESGTLRHWTGAGAVKVVSFAAHSGKYSAEIGNAASRTANSSIKQTFTAHGGAKLSFWYYVSCPTTVSRSWVTATLTDIKKHVTRTVLPRTCSAKSGWRQVTVTVRQNSPYTLTFATRDPRAPGRGTYALFDDVVNS